MTGTTGTTCLQLCWPSVRLVSVLGLGQHGKARLLRWDRATAGTQHGGAGQRAARLKPSSSAAPSCSLSSEFPRQPPLGLSAGDRLLKMSCQALPTSH